jgi:hypothetical protein
MSMELPVKHYCSDNAHTPQLAVRVLIGLMIGSIIGLLAPQAQSAPGERHYDEVITTVAGRYSLEPALVKAVIRCESAFDPLALSPRGAQGLMQLMPATQTLLGVPDAFEPTQNIAGGTRYLAMLRQQFGNDLTLILAAYNAGPQAVIKAGYTVPPYAETQNYVRCVQAAYEHYRQYGLQQPFSGTPRAPGARRIPGPGDTTRGLVVSPLRFSSRVVRVGERFTISLEAINTGPQLSHGVVMLNYLDHLVSFMALHTNDKDTMVQLSSMPVPTTATRSLQPAYRLLWRDWPNWRPGERRTATVTLVPHLVQDLRLHLSVVLNTPQVQGTPPHRWSSIINLPFASTTW